MKTKVLIVEDEALLALSYKLSLEKKNIQVTGIVATGEDAVRESERERPDVVLMDIKLGGSIDGIEAARILSVTQGVPCLFITGNADETTKNRALKLVGPLRYLVKPVDSDSLGITIENMVNRI